MKGADVEPTSPLLIFQSNMKLDSFSGVKIYKYIVTTQASMFTFNHKSFFLTIEIQ